jgi:hypothetical protein
MRLFDPSSNPNDRREIEKADTKAVQPVIAEIYAAAPDAEPYIKVMAMIAVCDGDLATLAEDAGPEAMKQLKAVESYIELCGTVLATMRIRGQI